MIVRIYTGQDGQTHFEDLPLPAEESHNVALQAGANLVFRCFPADYFSDWHTAPRRQYIFILAGQMEIGIGDGTTRRFGPGDVVLADDLTGQGHTTRSVGGSPHQCHCAGGRLMRSWPPSTHEDTHGTSRHLGIGREGAGSPAGTMTHPRRQDGSVTHEETAHARASTYDDPTEDLVSTARIICLGRRDQSHWCEDGGSAGL